MKEQHGLSGRLHIVLTDPSGRVVDERRVDNLITTSGRALLARLFAGQAQISELRIAVGSNGTALDASKATLTAVADAKASVADPSISDDGKVTAKVVATLPATGDVNTQQLQEAGILMVVGNNKTVYNRVTFPVVSRAGNLEMTLSWEVTF